MDQFCATNNFFNGSVKKPLKVFNFLTIKDQLFVWGFQNDASMNRQQFCMFDSCFARREVRLFELLRLSLAVFKEKKSYDNFIAYLT